ncbi:hypothetical protein HY638_00925 [Candidatus Woesearchaeota archaeon]|nr:hypothetical protein [Candidatus Woesearchaeota archaeon]
MISENFGFLMKGNFDKYSGEWIAVSENKIVAVGKSASEVIDKAKNIRKRTIMKIPNKRQILLL